jgi:hypothetical protein
VSLFDLLFMAVFLVTVVALLSAAVLALRGQGSRALILLRNCCIFVAAYLGIVIAASVFWPRRVLHMGEPRCFDDWCITVENANRQHVGKGVAYVVTLRVSSTARRVTQREKNLVVYLADSLGRRYDPVPDEFGVPLSVQLSPQESIDATRSFLVPADARQLGLVIAHEGGFPIGWFILGYETWFHKPALMRLPAN